MAIKTVRNLSGVYYRSQNKETKSWENVCFEDLPDDEQENILGIADEAYLKRLIKILATTLNDIGDKFGITT